MKHVFGPSDSQQEKLDACLDSDNGTIVFQHRRARLLCPLCYDLLCCLNGCHNLASVRCCQAKSSGPAQSEPPLQSKLPD